MIKEIGLASSNINIYSTLINVVNTIGRTYVFNSKNKQNCTSYNDN